MTNLNLSVDMDRVQSSVQAAIRPAVEAALSEVDFKRLIADALTVKRQKSREDYFLARYVHFGEQDNASLLEGMIQQGISSIAKEYVEQWLSACRGDIEEAFRKMMTGSSNRLVKAFAKATERALEEEWAFNLKVEVEHAQPATETILGDD